MISKQYKTIFVHIHKTAGSSIEKKLGLYDELHRGAQDHSSVRDYENIVTNGAKKYYFRRSLSNIKYGKYADSLKNFGHVFSPELTREQYDSFFKFSFVRNSWSRAHSWYKNVMRDEIHRRKYKINSDCTFKEFLEILDHDEFSQLAFLQDSKGNVPLDFIGKFEKLNEDFSYVCQQIGMKDDKLPELLVTKNKHYSEFFDDETKDMVYKIYRDEIDYFKFEFGE